MKSKLSKALVCLSVVLFVSVLFSGCISNNQTAGDSANLDNVFGANPLSGVDRVEMACSLDGARFFVGALLPPGIHAPEETPKPTVYSAVIGSDGTLIQFSSFCQDEAGAVISESFPGQIVFEGKKVPMKLDGILQSEIDFSSADGSASVHYVFYNFGISVKVSTDKLGYDWVCGINFEGAENVSKIYNLGDMTQFISEPIGARFSDISVRLGSSDIDAPLMPMPFIVQSTRNYLYRYVDLTADGGAKGKAALSSRVCDAGSVLTWGTENSTGSLPIGTSAFNFKVRYPVIETKKYKVHTGEEQVYNIITPSWYDSSEKWPLVIDLHGFGGDHVGYMNRHADWALSLQASTTMLWGAIKILPMCHGGNASSTSQELWYNKTAEQYIFELVDLVKSQYNIDENRIIVMGDSMGGQGTLNLACHYPDKFSAFLSIFPPVDLETLYYYTRVTKGNGVYDIPATMENAFHGSPSDVQWNYWQNSGYYLCENLYNLPIVFGQGAIDVMCRPLQCDRLAQRLDELGYPYTYMQVNSGHDDSSYFAMLDQAADMILNSAPRNPSPEKVVYKTNDVYYGNAYWASITGLEKEHEFAAIDARKDLKNNWLQVQVSNANSISLDCNLAGMDFERDIALSIKTDCKCIFALTGVWSGCKVSDSLSTERSVNFKIEGETLYLLAGEGQSEFRISKV
ncbi:MAG: alpha/beta hydrolase-fold protein [Candidatus Thermoplasmatota archaeon]|nr:alpha/beta hydrolase-fold protein [Candidatus Thermoplasmatota archaeon]